MRDPAAREGERRLLEQVASLARSLRADRERLAARLCGLAPELAVLATRLDGEPAVIGLGRADQASRDA
jgi:hypothetical protein